MEIVPHTKIYLLENVRLDNTYENTIFWEQGQEAAQQAYFMSKCPNLSTHSFSDVNYQRVNKGVLRIKGIPEIIMRCNYMMFQNRIEMIDYPNDGTTTNQNFDWVYAFITDVTYVSTFCAEITYEIDVMQTFHFKYALGSCFVEREHTLTDEIGEHIIDEGLPVGDYNYHNLFEYLHNETTGETDRYRAFRKPDDAQSDIVVACTFDDQYQDTYGVEYNSFFSGLTYHRFSNTQAGRTECKTFIENAASLSTGNKVDEITAIFYAPKWAMDFIDLPTPTIPHNSHRFKASDFYADFDGYTPKNNKMYTYPYNYLYVYNGSSDVAEYKVEKFAVEDNPDSIFYGMFTLEEYFDFSCSPCVILFPHDYANLAENLMEGLTLGPFPQLAWISDSYKAWIAQNGTSLITSGISSALGMGGSAINAGMNYKMSQTTAAMSQAGSKVGTLAGLSASAGAIAAGVGIALNLFNTVLDTFTQIDYAKRLPDQVHGNINSSQLMCARGGMAFYAYRRHVRRDYAESLDNFFTMYGYKVNKVETPNRRTRKIFTYVKTANCQLVTDRVPTAYEGTILSIYNNGIRFWRNGDQIGNYGGDNSPINT